MNFAMKMPPNHHFMLNGIPVEPVSRTYQYRKIMKPMLERKRRARINKCLDELKDLMTGTLQADGENVSKLEKADILELTVRHLHRLRESNALFPRRNRDTINMDKFWAGFQHCAAEVSQFLSKYDQNVSNDLIKYIANYIPNIAAQAAVAAANIATVSTTANAIAATASTTMANSHLNLTAMTTHQQQRKHQHQHQHQHAVSNQFPLSVNKPKPIKYDRCRNPLISDINEGNASSFHHQSYKVRDARVKIEEVSTDGIIFDGDGAAGVWRPW